MSNSSQDQPDIRQFWLNKTKMSALRWATVDIRDEFAKFERENRKWPRSRSCSKPYPKRPMSYDAAVEHAKEEFYRWHSMKLVLDD
jgi:hypothetical protein